MNHCFRLLIATSLFGAATAWAADAVQQIVILPQESDAILANPDMGWQTFHSTARQDQSLPSWIPSTVCYFRWGWRELEPSPGKINTALLDRTLQDAHDVGQKLAFRVMNCSTDKGHPYHPAWLRTVGGKEILADYEGTEPLPIPDMDDRVTLRHHLDFIRQLGQRYDGHPDISSVDLGSMGWWGEWHLSGSQRAKSPTRDARKQVVDAYLAAFQKTPLLMPIGGGDCLKYACSHGTGWRADCLGDLGGFSDSWCHMRQGYPTWIHRAGIGAAWKSAPVAWETCWDMRKWVDEGWSLRYIFNYALACHASVINNKSAPLPRGENARRELERFLRTLGYRLVLKELKHPVRVSAGGQLPIAMKWQNIGSAPCYKPYRLAYRLSDDRGSGQVLIGNVTVNRWLPGSIDPFTDEFFQGPKDLPPGPLASATDSVVIPEDLPAGQYTLAIAVVEAAKPVVQLGIKGRAEDGWYPLSQLKITE